MIHINHHIHLLYSNMNMMNFIMSSYESHMIHNTSDVVATAVKVINNNSTIVTIVTITTTNHAHSGVNCRYETILRCPALFACLYN